MAWNAARGVHCTDDLQQAFAQAVEAYLDWEDGMPEPTVELGGQQVKISAVCGLLWNCPDLVNSQSRSSLRHTNCPYADRPVTYSRAARLLEALVLEALERDTFVY